MVVKILGENFAGVDVDDYKNPVMDRNVTQWEFGWAIMSELSDPILRSSLTSGRGSLLAHMLVMLGSLATMLVFARLVANPAHYETQKHITHKTAKPKNS